MRSLPKLTLLGLLLWPAVAAAAPASCNLVANGDFHQTVEGWVVAADDAFWTPEDVAADQSSGALHLVPTGFVGVTGGWVHQCVALPAGTFSLAFGTAVRIFAEPGDFPYSSAAILELYADASCEGAVLASGSTQAVTTFGRWHRVQGEIDKPPAATHARVAVELRRAGPPFSPLAARFDDVFLLPDRLPPPAPLEPSEEYLGYSFAARITSQSGDMFLAAREPACPPENVCFSGALPGRSEVAVRLLGPRPNGFIWPAISKWSPSKVEVWIEQHDSGALRYYCLDGARPGDDRLEGLFDRFGFAP